MFKAQKVNLTPMVSDYSERFYANYNLAVWQSAVINPAQAKACH